MTTIWCISYAFCHRVQFSNCTICYNKCYYHYFFSSSVFVVIFPNQKTNMFCQWRERVCQRYFICVCVCVRRTKHKSMSQNRFLHTNVVHTTQILYSARISPKPVVIITHLSDFTFTFATKWIVRLHFFFSSKTWKRKKNVNPQIYYTILQHYILLLCAFLF